MSAPAPRATGSSRISRTAKAGLRDLHTLYWIAKHLNPELNGENFVEAGIYHRRNTALPALRGFSVDGALPSAFPSASRKSG